MTTLIPNNCVGSHPATLQLHKALYELLGPDFKVVQHLVPQKELPGSLFWIEKNRQSLFIYQSHCTPDEFAFKKNNQEGAKALLANPHIDKLLKFQNILLPKQLQAHKAELAPLLMIFSNINNEHVNIGIKSSNLYLLGKEYLRGQELGKIVHKLLGKQYSQNIHNYMRHIFSPETLISKQNNLQIPSLANLLLNHDQELAMKLDISLPPEKRRVKNFNLAGINGGASSGKSETLIKRVKLLRDLEPETNLLLLTINKYSQKNLKDSYSKISPKDKNTEILNFYQWCQEKLKTVPRKLVYIDDVIDLIENKIGPQLKKNDISIATFLHELDYIHGRVIFYEKDYVKTPQISQPYSLSREQYSQVWKAALSLKGALISEDLMLWSELPQRLWDSLQKKPFIQDYDHILVDDSHFFPPIAFELFKKMLKPNSGQLFITQDPNQGLINPCILWKDTGLDLRGESVRLNSFYDINPYILNATNAFYLNRLPEQTDKHILQNLPISKDKPIPELLHFNTIRDEENRLINEIKNYIKIGQKLEDILIITMNRETSKRLNHLVKKTLDITLDQLDENEFQYFQERKRIGICNIMQTQGLKAQYVFIFGIAQLLDQEKNTSLDTNESQILWRENTQKLSNAMSRARKKLTLFLTAEKIPDSFLSPHIKTPTADSSFKAQVSYLQNT